MQPLNEEQRSVLDVFLTSISTQHAQKNVGIRKFITDVIPSFLAILSEDEKRKAVGVYQAGIENTQSLSRLKEIEGEAERIGFSGITKAAGQKIDLIKRKKPKREPKLKGK